MHRMSDYSPYGWLKKQRFLFTIALRIVKAGGCLVVIYSSVV